jgi:hypothetical protein
VQADNFSHFGVAKWPPGPGRDFPSENWEIGAAKGGALNQSGGEPRISPMNVALKIISERSVQVSLA